MARFCKQNSKIKRAGEKRTPILKSFVSAVQPAQFHYNTAWKKFKISDIIKYEPR